MGGDATSSLRVAAPRYAANGTPVYPRLPRRHSMSAAVRSLGEEAVGLRAAVRPKVEEGPDGGVFISAAYFQLFFYAPLRLEDRRPRRHRASPPVCTPAEL
ncbi:unnamed protein product [Merluccius merluccius]